MNFIQIEHLSKQNQCIKGMAVMMIVFKHLNLNSRAICEREIGILRGFNEYQEIICHFFYYVSVYIIYTVYNIYISYHYYSFFIQFYKLEIKTDSVLSIRHFLYNNANTKERFLNTLMNLVRPRINL